MRYGVTARRKRNMRRVGELAAMRRERREARRAQGVATMAAQDAKASGALVIEAEKISKSYGDRPIVKDFSLRVMRGDRIGVVGANGAGKTTLINLLTGALAPDSGAVRLGANVAMASLDQRRASLQPTTTLVDALTGGGSDFVAVNGERKHVVGYMKDFLFSPDQARTPIGKLSGGERGRLMLARALALPSNLMVLDEPTNDLDIETLDLLQELLGDYPGTMLLVSHDRDFLDRVATSVIVAEGDGPLARIRRRLFRHGRPARLRPLRAAGAEAPKPEKTAARETARPARQAQDVVQRKARAGDAAGQNRSSAGRDRRAGARARRSRAARARSPGLRSRDQILCGQARRARRGGRRLAGARNPARGDRGVELRRLRPPAPFRRSRRNRPCRRAAPRR